MMMQYKLTATDEVLLFGDNSITTIPNDPNDRYRKEYLAWLEAGNVPDPYVPPPEDFKGPAQAALDASDITMLRCVENDVAVPAAWKTYRVALRTIIKTNKGPLPTRPAFPAGT